MKQSDKGNSGGGGGGECFILQTLRSQRGEDRALAGTPEEEPKQMPWSSAVIGMFYMGGSAHFLRLSEATR